MRTNRVARYGCVGLLLATVVGAGLFAELFLADIDEREAERAVDGVRRDFARFEEATRLYGRRHGGRVAPALDELAPDAPFDPWGRPYRYEADEAQKSARVLTLGRDGAPGGEGADADRELALAGTRRDGR